MALAQGWGLVAKVPAGAGALRHKGFQLNCGDELSNLNVRSGSTVSQASEEGERPVPRRADLLHCLSALEFDGGSVRRNRPRLCKTALGHPQAKLEGCPWRT